MMPQRKPIPPPSASGNLSSARIITKIRGRNTTGSRSALDLALWHPATYASSRPTIGREKK
jgi:hypothetical protein